MATNKQNDIQTTVTTPAFLWIGNNAFLVMHTIEFLQKIFCKNNHCKICTTCNQINQQEYHAIIWIKPAKEFVLEELAIIAQTISFKLEPHEQFFFVIQNADYMRKACANSLLKILEEPPMGYHFILLAEQQQTILPTIVSRCLVSSFYQKEETVKYHHLFNFFTTTNFNDPMAFLQELDTCAINELEARALLDRIFIYWSDKCKQEQLAQKKDEYTTAQHVINILKQLALQPPMPGSSKFFLKNLFMQIKNSSS